MDAWKSTTVTPIHSIILPRFTGQDNWVLCDMAVDSFRFAVCGYNDSTNRTSMDLFKYHDSLPLIQCFYSMEFHASSRFLRRYISFTDDASRIVTVYGRDLDLNDINNRTRVTHRKMAYNAEAVCVTVIEREIFIGLVSKKVVVFDFKLNKIKTIILQGLGRDYIVDIAVYYDNMYICTGYFKTLKYDMSGGVHYDYAEPDQVSAATSICVDSTLDLVFVGGHNVVVYSPSYGLEIFSFPIDISYVTRTRINNVNRLFIATMEGELTVYDTTSIFTFNHLKNELSSRFTKKDCVNIRHYFSLPPHQDIAISDSHSYTENLLLDLEERLYIQPSDTNRLTHVLFELKINHDYIYSETYMKLRARETDYGTFLAGLSAHMTLSMTKTLCIYFKFTDEQINLVISSQSPGLSFLLTLEEMDITSPSNVRKLEIPLQENLLIQAVAKLHEYQSLLDSDRTKSKQDLSIEDKHTLFIKCLKQKIKSWFETITPIPWKKSCQWKSDDLFIASGLVLKTPGSRLSDRYIDPKCKLHYTEVFSHDRLKTESRIIIEGEPGAGKTMLSSQMAYDWSCGKIKDVPILVYLPLKIVEDMTIIEAIKMFYIRKGIPISEGDIESILNNDTNTIYLILDGLEEYNGRPKPGDPSEVMRVMTKQKLSNCTVVLTARSEYVQGLPFCPILKIGGFGEDERNEYIEKVFSDNLKRQDEVKGVIAHAPFIIDICSVPLLFVLSVHNIDSLEKLRDGQVDRITPFVKAIVEILSPTQKEEYYTFSSQEASLDYQQTKMALEELAFNGLCRGHQQLLWQKYFVDEHIGNSKTWVDAGILVVEQGLPTKEIRTTASGSGLEENMENASTSQSHQTVSSSGKDSVASSDEYEINDAVDKANSTKSGKRDDENGKGIIQRHNLPSTKHSKQTGTIQSKNTESNSLSRVSRGEYATLQIKFLHKLIQEWFAAKRLALLFWGYNSAEKHYKYQLFREHLANIDPADLHYVLRFTCNICPASFHFITSFLMREFKTGDDPIPDYIMNCICLCFAEYDGYRGHRIKDIITEICGEEIISISSEDSRLLLRSKVSLLVFASISKIPIKRLILNNIVQHVTKTFIELTYGVRLGNLDTLEAIEVNRWDQTLQATDYENVIKFIAENRSIKTACLTFPSPPVIVKDYKILNNLLSRNSKVEWIIGGNLIHTLDLNTGDWMIEFRKPDDRSRNAPVDHAAEDESMSNDMRVQLRINQEGGILEIAGSGVCLEIPPGALECECLIKMRIIASHFQEESNCSFAKNSSVVVELLPTNLHLLKPAKLTVPHCLVLNKGCEWRARVYSSHHVEGTHPLWEEEPYTANKLNARSCEIWLHTFSWEKFDVGDEIVEGKNIILYAAKSLSSTESITHIHLGYYLDLPGNDEVLNMNDIVVLLKQPAVFYKEGHLPLKFVFESIDPETWTVKNTPEEISFKTVATNKSRFVTYVLNRVNSKLIDDCTCYFKAWQGTSDVDLIFILKMKNVVLPSTSAVADTKTSHPTVTGITMDSTVSDDSYIIQYLSKNLTTQWKDVGRKLKITEGELFDLNKDNTENVQNAKYDMVMFWRKKQGDDATYRVLATSLIDAGRKDLHDYVVEEVKLMTQTRSCP